MVNCVALWEARTFYREATRKASRVVCVWPTMLLWVTYYSPADRWCM